MISLNLNGESLTVPTGWGDFTVGHAQKIFFEMENEPQRWFDNFLFRFSVYTGEKYEKIENLNFSDAQIIQLMDLVSFEREKFTEYLLPMGNALQFYRKEEGTESWLVRVPKEAAAFKDTTRKIPNKIEQRAVGSKIVFEQLVIPEYKSKGHIVHVMHFAIAIYMQPIYYMRAFDTDLVEQLAEICLHCNFLEAFTVADFFLKRWQNL